MAEAHRRGLALAVPSAVVETPGEGLEGVVEGHGVIVGGLRFVAERAESDGLGSSDRNRAPGSVAVAVGIDGLVVATLILADTVREGTGALLEQLRAIGIWWTASTAFSQPWPLPCGRAGSRCRAFTRGWALSVRPA